MATYKKFSELPEITEATESTKVPVLDGGTMKLLNGAKLGGDTGVKTVIIKEANYDTAIDNIINGGSGSAAPMVSVPATPVFTASMTFEEACEILNAGEPLQGIMQLDPNNVGARDSTAEGYMAYNLLVDIGYIYDGSNRFIEVSPVNGSFSAFTVYWTADGVSTEYPSSGNEGTPV